MLLLDGSQGEGGGQILRTALALALVTGTPFRMERIRARRAKPGLQRQHLTAVMAAAEVGDAALEGASLGSQQLVFQPRAIRPGNYRFAIGTAGSATLVLQTVLPALWSAPAPSNVEIEGGTHNPLAPPFDFLQRVFLPLLERMGPRIVGRLERHGFYPAGGGRATVTVEPHPLRPIELLERGPVIARHVRVLVSRLPRSIAEREVAAVCRGLDWPPECATIERVDSAGPGNAVLVEIACQRATEVFSAFGQRGVPAEAVAEQVVAQTLRWLRADVPVGEHLADQLLLPLALAGGGRFRTVTPSSHFQTNRHTIGQFLDHVAIEVEPQNADTCLVSVRTARGAAPSSG